MPLSSFSHSDSLVSSHVYEIIKTIYSTTASETTESTRISVIQNTLGQLRLANIATLDAISTHFTRLIELTSADEAFVSALAHNIAPCVLRPRNESSLTMHERNSYRLVRDLFSHKDAVFGELKRASALSHTASGSGRTRAISTDESNRRANMEARNRAIASRSRASSPQPGPGRAHRRDRSTGPAETRFPIQTSPTSTTDRKITRHSLDIPESTESSPVVDLTNKSIDSSANGNANHGPAAEEITASTPSNSIEKRDSLGRSTGIATSARFPRKTPTANLARHSLTGTNKNNSQHDNENAVEAERPVGVSLSDKPMDD